MREGEALLGWRLTKLKEEDVGALSWSAVREGGEVEAKVAGDVSSVAPS